jgi:hypothetical protein
MLVMRLELTDGTYGIYRLCFPFGDGNRDGRVDVADFSLMQNCWSGVDIGPECDSAVFDMNADGDVDWADFALFQQLYSGG